MTEQKKSPTENKSQPVQQQKPAPDYIPKDFLTGRVAVGDSAEGLRKKGK